MTKIPGNIYRERILVSNENLFKSFNGQFSRMKFTKNRDELIANVPPGCTFAELGVFSGAFSEKIRSLLKPKKLYLVDIFNGKMGSGDVNGENFHFINLNESFDQLTQKYAKQPEVKIVKATTVEFLESLPDDHLDAVYIDADHSYEAVKQDLKLSLQKVGKNGFIMGHDYEENEFPGVVQAVDEFCEQNDLKICLLSQEKLPSFLIKKA
jgi:hypothetical protein